MVDLSLLAFCAAVARPSGRSTNAGERVDTPLLARTRVIVNAMDVDFIVEFDSCDDLLRTCRVRSRTESAGATGPFPTHVPEEGPSVSTRVHQMKHVLAFAGQKKNVHEQVQQLYQSVPVRTQRLESLVECVDWIRSEGANMESYFLTSYRSVSIACGMAARECIKHCERVMRVVQHRDHTVHSTVGKLVSTCRQVEEKCVELFKRNITSFDEMMNRAIEKQGEEEERLVRERIRSHPRPRADPPLSSLITMLPAEASLWSPYLDTVERALRRSGWSSSSIDRATAPFREYARLQSRAESEALRAKSIRMMELSRTKEKKIEEFSLAMKHATKSAMEQECALYIHQLQKTCNDMDVLCDSLPDILRREGKKCRRIVLNASTTNDEWMEQESSNDDHVRDIRLRLQMFADGCDRACSFASDCILSANKCFFFDS